MKRNMHMLLAMIVGSILGIVIMRKENKKNMIKLLSESNKNLTRFRLMNNWVKVKQKKKNLSEYFEGAGYKKIAIYGMGYIGETLFNELIGTKTEVLYGIDRNADTVYADINIVSLKDEFPQVDVVVITTVDIFEIISEQIQKKIDCPIISIIDVVYDI